MSEKALEIAECICKLRDFYLKELRECTGYNRHILLYYIRKILRKKVLEKEGRGLYNLSSDDCYSVLRALLS